MDFEKPEAGRAVVSDDDYGLKVVIPSIKNYIILILLCMWWLGWLFGAIAATGFLLTTIFGVIIDSDSLPIWVPLFISFWLIAWLLGGLSVLWIILWLAVGKEVMILDSISLIIEKRVFRICRRKHYLLSDINNFRINPVNTGGMPQLIRIKALEQFGSKNATLAFDYGMKTMKFATAIDEAEARYILELFKQRGISVL